MFSREEADTMDSRLDHDKLERSLLRFKNQKYPRVPDNLNEIVDVINKEENLIKYGNSLDNKNKFYVSTIVNNAHTFMVFASFKTIEMIERYIEPEYRRYLMDGTFKIKPKHFYQLLIIAIEYKNDVIILIFIIFLQHNYFRFIFTYLDLPCILHTYDEQVK